MDELRARVNAADELKSETLRRLIHQPHGSAARAELERAYLEAKRSAALLRRQLAQETGEEHAVWLDIGVEPDAAVSGALLVQSEYRCFLLFDSRANQELDEESGRLKIPQVIIEFTFTNKTLFGLPNDEALGGHPLFSRGLNGGYGAYEVVNSHWRDEEERRNQVKFPQSKFNCRHFIFVFHDSSFECLADDLKISVDRRPFDEIWNDLHGWLND